MPIENSANDVKFHQIEGTHKEWIEYPADSYVIADTREDGYFILCCANILKDQPQLVQELKELYGSEVDVVEKWIRIEVLRNPNGKIVKQKNIVHNCTPPIIKEGFTHSLSFRGKDENYLKFIKWDVDRKLAERNKLAKLDVKISDDNKERNVAEGILTSKLEMNTEPSFKIEGGEHKGEVDIPHFLNAENNTSDKSYRTSRMPDELSTLALFKHMEQVMDDFFKGFPDNF